MFLHFYLHMARMMHQIFPILQHSWSGPWYEKLISLENVEFVELDWYEKGLDMNEKGLQIFN